MFEEFGDGFKVTIFRKVSNEAEKVSNETEKVGNTFEIYKALLIKAGKYKFIGKMN